MCNNFARKLLVAAALRLCALPLGLGVWRWALAVVASRAFFHGLEVDPLFAAVGAQAGDQHLEASVQLLHSAIPMAARASPARLAVGCWWKMLGDIIVRLGAEGADGCYLEAHDYLEVELGPQHALTLEVKRLLELASQ